MRDVFLLLHQLGVPGLALIVFAKRMGVPVPALPFLLLAGARGAHDPFFALAAAMASAVAAMVADGMWFVAGRQFGRGMLALMCKLSIAPDTCIRRSEGVFARRGDITVVLAKFIPGVAGVTPPLAGALGMPLARFALLNAAGTGAWVGAGVGLGWLLHREVALIVATLERLGGFALPLALLAGAAYLAWLVVRRVRARRAALRLPTLRPRQLADRLFSGERVVVVDVRGEQDLVRQRLPGALLVGSERELDAKLSGAGKQQIVVVYCDCPGDASAARMAARLHQRGWAAHVLMGGFEAWRSAGLPLESVHLAPSAA